MGIFDRDTQTATMERPRTETAKSEMQGTMPGTMAGASQVATGASPMAAGAARTSTMSARTGAKPVFKVRWTNQEGEVVTEYMQTLGPTGKSMATLQIAKPEGWPAGQYKLEFLLGDVAAATMDFEVR